MSEEKIEPDLIVDHSLENQEKSCSFSNRTKQPADVIVYPMFTSAPNNVNSTIRLKRKVMDGISENRHVSFNSKICKIEDVRNLLHKPDQSQISMKMKLSSNSNQVMMTTVSEVKKKLENASNNLKATNNNGGIKRIVFKDASGKEYHVVKVKIDVATQTEKHPILSIDSIKDNNKAIEYYTGLQNFDKLMCVFKTLEPDIKNLEYYYNDERVNLLHQDQFFMTLILLRQQKPHTEISLLFDISLKDIKNIFITWVKFMSLQWSDLKVPKTISKPKDYQSNEKQSTVKNIPEHEDLIVIDGANSSVDDKTKFKKVYKILNGPKNYMESHLMNDIVTVCHVLCFFRLSKNNTILSLCAFKLDQ